MGDERRKGTVPLRTAEGTTQLLWGDLLQIIARDGDTATVRARGKIGEFDLDDISEGPLLEVSFIDVGQGDGLLVRLPDGRHVMIDGGLDRTKQRAGKSAADFVDKKALLQPMEDDMREGRVRVDFDLTIPARLMNSTSERKRAWRSRAMQKNHDGLLNVRTDGETVMCATSNEAEKKWLVHRFPGPVWARGIRGLDTFDEQRGSSLHGDPDGE